MNIPEQDRATRAEVDEALDSLTDGQVAKLGAIASTFCFGLKGHGRTADDLLYEAMCRTVEGERAWRKGVDIIKHLAEAMRSISHSWRKPRKVKKRAILQAELVRVVEGEDHDVYTDLADTVGSGESSPETACEVAEIVSRLKEEFADAPLVRDILEWLAEGYSPTEVRDLMELDQKTYEAAMKKLRRHARQLFPEVYDNG